MGLRQHSGPLLRFCECVCQIPAASSQSGWRFNDSRKLLGKHGHPSCNRSNGASGTMIMTKRLIVINAGRHMDGQT